MWKRRENFREWGGGGGGGGSVVVPKDRLLIAVHRTGFISLRPIAVLKGRIS